MIRNQAVGGAAGRRASTGARMLCVLLVAGLAPATAGAETIAFTDATVHPVSGQVMEAATVVVTDGRISAVGRTVAPPTDARKVSLAGKHLYPGMVSANSVIGLVEVRTVAGSNDLSETGNINPNIRAETQINPDSEHFPVARINGITSALVVPRGGVITGTSALVHLDGWTFEDMTVRAPVALHVNWPNMRPRQGFFEQRSDEEQMKARDEALAELGQAFDDARAWWKAREAEGARDVPRHDHDVKWLAMGPVLRGGTPIVFHAETLDQIRAVLDFVDAHGLTRVLIEGGHDTPLVAAELKARGIGVICDRTHQLPRRSYEPYDAGFTVPAKLFEAGVDYCIADGAGGGGMNPMNTRNLPYMAALASAHGLPREEALKAITLHPARMLGAGDRLGSIEPGKIADLVVTDGDLLEITTKVEQVYIAGRAVPMTSKQVRLFEKYDSRPRSAPGGDETRAAK